jgi:hypothetical protein
MKENAEEWLPCRYIAGVGKNLSTNRYRVERLDGVTRYFKSKAQTLHSSRLNLSQAAGRPLLMETIAIPFLQIPRALAITLIRDSTT